jgi:hypothetical protein
LIVEKKECYKVIGIQQNCTIFSKKMFTTKVIKKEIYPCLKFGHQKNTKVKLYQVIKAILYRLKTGCQWKELPMNCFFRLPYRWQSVYHHF